MARHWQVLAALLQTTALWLGNAQVDAPELDTVTFCSDDDASDHHHLCLNLGFINLHEGGRHLDVVVTCGSWSGGIEQVPDILDFWEAGPLQDCKHMSFKSPQCTYKIATPKSRGPSTVFCAQLAPVKIALPECKEGGSCGLTVEGSDQWPLADFGVKDLASALLLMVYIVAGYLARQLQYVHETQLAVIMGLIVGSICNFWYDINIEFDYEAFSWFLLPMVIFGAGYNLDTECFFQHAHYILAFGVVGTGCISAILFLASSFFEFTTLDRTKAFLPTSERALMAAVLASTDSVAPMAFLPSETFPTLYAVVFGEGIMNDVVSILLGTVVAESRNFPSLPVLSRRVLHLGCTSLLMGMVFGLALSFFFRRMKMYQRGTVQPAALLFIGNYLCYIVTELIGFSAILALFVSAVLCGHYAKHSLSFKAREFTEDLAEYFSYNAEAFVFGYFGLAASTLLGDQQGFSLDLILSFTASILVSRVVTVVIVSWAVACFLGENGSPLNLRELCVITLAGCMRGTIAYALILKPMPSQMERTALDQLLVNTVLGIVLINCLIFGGLFPLVTKLLGLESGQSQSEAPMGSRSSMQMVRQDRLRMRDAWNSFDEEFIQPVLRSRPTQILQPEEQVGQ